MPDSPQHACPAMLIECIICIILCINNEQESALFFLLMQLPELCHRINTSFNSCFKTSAKLVNSTNLLGFVAGDKKKSLGDRSPPSLTNT
jgi:hypothetical protein